jgi:hypothetical protein
VSLTVRPATRADIESYAGRPSAQTIRAIVGELDGEIIAIGGLAIVKGRYYAFLDLKEEARQYKMHIMRTAIRMLTEARRTGVRFIFAEADQSECKSVAWLRRLGFKPDPRSDHLLQWKSSEWQD